MNNPTPEQVLFAEAPEKYIFCGALAGTGKTWTTSLRVKTQIDLGRPVALVCSFTKSARDAILDSLQNFGISDVQAKTIHSLAYDLCREHIPGFTISETRLNHYAYIAWREYFGGQEPTRTQIDEIQKTSSYIKNRAVSGWQTSTPIKVLKEVAVKYDRLRAKDRVYSFDDAIEMATILATPLNGEIIVDEAQDMTRTQATFIMKLAGSHNPITLIGDENQAIYFFAGVSGDFGLKPQALKNFSRYTLTKSFRSSQAIIDIANRSLATINEFKSSTNVDTLITDIPGGSVSWIDVPLEQQINTLAYEIQPGDTVLARTNKQALAIREHPLVRTQYPDSLSWEIGVNEQPVHLTTIHRAKGLEYPNTVHLLGTSRDGFTGRTTTLEELNLFYVALTRAKSDLVIYNNTPERRFLP